VATTKDNRAPKKGRARDDNEQPVSAPADVHAVLRHGGTAALVCAAASSAVSLFWLAILVGWPPALAWLLPASLDVYAGTSLYVGYRLPGAHPAANTARRNARFALSLSVACNGIYHALVLFGAEWPYWVHDSLLVAVSALPPVVVERLLHLRSKIGNGHAAASDTVAAPAPKAAAGTDNTPAVVKETGKPPLDRQSSTEADIDNPATGNPEDPTTRIGNPATQTGKPPVNDNPSDRQAQTGNPSDRQKPAVKQPAAGQPSTDTWVEIGKPLYDRLRIELGKRPGETKFHAYLSECVAELIEDGVPVGANKDESPEVYANPSLSTAKRIRKEIEDRFPGIVFGHAQDAAEGQLDLTEEAAS
jgi:hypothetical protein